MLVPQKALPIREQRMQKQIREIREFTIQYLTD